MTATSVVSAKQLPSQPLRLGEKGVGFRSDIQGLRAIAVVCVVLYHANLPGMTGGYIGVDVFFVISGFLITAHLLSELGADGKISFLRFYARRVRRILPASIAVLVFSLLAAWIWIPPLILSPIWKDSAATVLYVPNFLFADEHVDYLSDPNPSLFQHYWSLGVEEQFYLVWPALLLIAFLLFRRSSRGVLNSLIVTLVVSLGFAVWLTYRAQPWAFFMVPTRAWEFAAGGVVAHLVSSTILRLPQQLRRISGWTGFVGLAISVHVFNQSTTFPGLAATLPVVGTVLIIMGGPAGNQPHWAVNAVLSTRPLVFVGAISYSMYLVHWPLLVIPQVATSERHVLPLWATLGLAALSVPFAWLIYKVVENPARNWRTLSERRPSVTIWVAAALTVCLTAGALVSLQMSKSSRFYTDAAVPETTISSSPVGASFVPRNMVPSVRESSHDNPAIYGSGCHLGIAETNPIGCTTGRADAPLSVALFGDSHAAQWYPALDALAERGRLVLTSHTKSSCPSFNVTSESLASPYPECSKWREQVVTRLKNHPPDVVVLANFVDSDLGGRGSDAVEAWSKAVEQTVSLLSIGSTVLVLADTPNFEISPPVCLSAHLTNPGACGRSPKDALSPTIASAVQTATKRGGGSFVDLTRYLCDDALCPVIIGNTLVYRDSHHLTASFSTLMADVLGASIVRSIGESND